MTTIKKLHLIEDTWRHYIWEYDFFREKLNFNDGLNTNYVGVIFGYFHDTLPILKNENKKNEKNSLENRFLNSIGILQLIYLQQDLISELKKSFGLTHKIDFGTNRELRSELIGHPISRYRDKSLKSFCLFGYNNNELGDITYLKYHKDNNFKFEAKGYFTNDIIENHFEFLNDSFDEILNKNKFLFIEFKKQLNILLNNFNDLGFEKLLVEISKYSNYFFKSNNVFSYENISKFHMLRDFHPRYDYNTRLFLKNIRSSLIEDINNINQKYLNKKADIIDNEYENLSCNYSFGKLYSKHPIFGISYFKERFSDDKNIIEELNNMEDNINDDFEYYSSYNYLQHLLNLNYPSFFIE